MNELNYASLEASKKLVDKGIVLETEVSWIKISKTETRRVLSMYKPDDFIPAPSMAEVWRELPNNVLPEAFNGLLRCRFNKEKEEDYLIELLIWVKENGK